LFDGNTAQQQEIARQADRKHEIIQHWQGNITYNKQNNRRAARESVLAGFDLVDEIHSDIISADAFVSHTACWSLNQLAAWCLAHENDARSTTWPRGDNSIEGLYRNDPADAQEEENWLALRGLRLVCDLDTFLGPFQDGSSAQLQKDCAMILRAVADRCFWRESACFSWSDVVGRASWAAWGDEILGILSAQSNNTVGYVSGAALDAEYDLQIRADWRSINYIREDDD
jgi:hypothetical protein